jgi:hypothetical protein
MEIAEKWTVEMSPQPMIAAVVMPAPSKNDHAVMVLK